MHIRLARQDDGEAIAQLHAQSWRSAYRGLFNDAFLDNEVVANRQQVWRQRFASPKPNQQVLVAEESQYIVGFICAYGNEHPRWGTYIDNLHVAQAHKGIGIGRRLMAAIARWSHQHYPDVGLYLQVLEANLPARRFYEKLGAMNQESSVWEPPGGGSVVDLRYVWSRPEVLYTVPPDVE
ncbi:MAG: GNAT family N-acetyltransferase [Gammaproteobacteria bacterium]|nr:GNAT family N-acetyltransferase [Gammaproteobacteria bacterium]